MVIAMTSMQRPAQDLCNLPVFHPVRARISQALLLRPDPGRLAAIMSLDPAFTAELLAAANSPAYGRAFQIYTAAEAIKILGWAETERIANAVFDVQERFKPEVQSLVRAHWAHSLASAVVASELARFWKMPEERAFAFGILHDIGIWGLMATSPDAYGQVFSQGSRTCIEKQGAEECMMGIDHCKAGSWLVKSWGLPAEFAEATAMQAENSVDGAGSVAAIVSLACRWADALGFPAGHSERIAVREVIRMAPSEVIPNLNAASAEIGLACRARLLEYAREFDPETARMFSKL